MAHFFKSTSGEIRQIVMMPAEEAAAVGTNFVQQQPPPSQHVVQLTSYQPHIHPSSLYQLAEAVQSPEPEPTNSVDAEPKVKVQISQPLQRKSQPLNAAVQQQQIQQIHQVLAAVQQNQLKAAPNSEPTQKIHIIRQALTSSVSQSQSKATRTIQQRVKSVPHIVNNIAQQHVQVQLKQQAVRSRLLQKPQVQVKRQFMQISTQKLHQQPTQYQFQEQCSQQQFQEQCSQQQLEQQAASQQSPKQSTVLQLHQQGGSLKSHQQNSQQQLQLQDAPQQLQQQTVQNEAHQQPAQLKLQQQAVQNQLQQQAVQNQLQQQAQQQAVQNQLQQQAVQNQLQQQAVQNQFQQQAVQNQLQQQIVQQQFQQHAVQHQHQQTIQLKLNQQVAQPKPHQQDVQTILQQQITEQQLQHQAAQQLLKLQAVPNPVQPQAAQQPDQLQVVQQPAQQAAQQQQVVQLQVIQQQVAQQQVAQQQVAQQQVAQQQVAQQQVAQQQVAQQQVAQQQVAQQVLQKKHYQAAQQQIQQVPQLQFQQQTLQYNPQVETSQPQPQQQVSHIQFVQETVQLQHEQHEVQHLQQQQEQQQQLLQQQLQQQQKQLFQLSQQSQVVQQSPGQTYHLKLPQSQVQQLHQRLATHGQQVFLVQPSQQHIIQQSSQHHILQHVSSQQQRLIRPVLVQKNQRFSTPVIIKRPVVSQQDSSQTNYVMMYPQIPVQQVAISQSSEVELKCQNNVAHSPEASRNVVVTTVSPQLSQGQLVTVSPSSCNVTKAHNVTPKRKTCRKVVLKQTPVLQQIVLPVSSSQEQEAQQKVPDQPHETSTVGSEAPSVNNIVTQAQIGIEQPKSQPLMEEKCRTAFVQNEVLKQVPKVQNSIIQEQQHQTSNHLQISLSQPQLQKFLQHHQLQVLQQPPQSLQQQVNSVSTEQVILTPSKSVQCYGTPATKKVQLIDTRHTVQSPKPQAHVLSSAQKPGDLQQQQFRHVQSPKVNLVVAADVFKQYKNLRLIVHPEGYASLQQMEPLADQQNIRENCVTVFDGMEVKDEFPTGVLQECVVSESGEVMLAPTTVKSEPDSNETSSCVGLSPMVVPKEEPVDEQVELTPDCGSDQPKPSEEDRQTASPDTNYVPRYVKGMMAVCSHCGILSHDFNRCDRCLRKMSENAKAMSILASGSGKSPANRRNPISIVATPISPVSSLSSILIKKEVSAEKLHGKQPSKPALHGTLLISPDLKKKTKPQRRVRTKVPEEPEILTLSSDDEDRKEEKSACETSAVDNKNITVLDAEAKAIGLSGEPDSSDETVRQSAGVEGGGMMEQAVDGSIVHPHVMIQCRTVRIGTFKEKPSERVTLSPQGIEIKLPPLRNVTLPDFRISLKMSEIKKVLVSFCRSMPVLFIYVRLEGAARIRELLSMTDASSSHYFDPKSHEETHKRITLLPEKLSDDQKIILKHIFQGVLTEVDNALANNILVKSSPRENPRHKASPQCTEIKTIMVYPPPPAKGGISINTEDYACLGEDQFLNDVIIDFYLKYLMQSVLSDEDRERTHVFSSFFYKRLTSRPKTKGRRHPIEDDPKLSSAQKRHARVKGWTKSVNLFTKDFIIIPINESCHWFLAIICFPGQDGCRRMIDNSLVDLPTPKTSSAVVAAAAAAAATTNAKLKVENNVMSIGSTTITPVKSAPPATITLDQNGEEGSDRDEAEGDEEEMDEPASDDESQEVNNLVADSVKTEKKDCKDEASVATALGNTSVKLKKPKERDRIKQPCILIFDSLVGAPRYRVVATLRDYLTIEYKAKEGKDKEFSKFNIKGMLPKVPQQNNFTDCGLYVLQYVESFFKNPIKDYHHPIKELLDWFPEEVVNRKREEIVHLLHDLMTQQNIDPKSLPLPVLNFSRNTPSEQQESEVSEASEQAPMQAEQQAGVQVAGKLDAAIQSSEKAEDDEAASRLAAAIQLKQQAEDEEAVSRLVEAERADIFATGIEEAEDSSMATEEETMLHTPSNRVPHVDVASQTINSALRSSAGESQVTVDNESLSADQNVSSHTSLVDYSESSDEGTSDQVTVKRGTEFEDSLIDRKKRKCVSDK